jgi:hypothetical protein
VRREKLKPILGILELGDLLGGNSNLGKDLILSGSLTSFSLCLSLFDFPAESASSSVNRHACAVESKREKDIFSDLLLISNLEFTFRHRECMTYIILKFKQSKFNRK